jgi:hypothetical protein
LRYEFDRITDEWLVVGEKDMLAIGIIHRITAHGSGIDTDMVIHVDVALHAIPAIRKANFVKLVEQVAIKCR